MSTYTDASLIYYPSGYKAGKAYSLKPTDGSGDLTFTRASTATRVNSSGLIESVAAGVPRIDYTGGGCGKLLLEPQRTNLALYSEQFDNAAWTKASSTITSNVAISPSGYQDADNWVGTAANLYRSGTAGVEYTISVYVKSNGQSKDNFVLRLGNSISTTFTATSEWQRFSFTGTPTTTLFGITTASAPNNAVDILVWGFQMEANSSYPTSYIPTLASSVTRLADSAFKTGISSLIGQTEGTLFVEFDIDSAVNTEGYIARIDVSSFNDTIYIVRSAISATLTMALRSGGSQIASVVLNNVSGRNKAAIAYKSGQFAFYLNGTQLGISTATYTNGITYDDFRIGGFNAATSNMAGGIHQALLFKTRLTNAELETLTTL